MQKRFEGPVYRWRVRAGFIGILAAGILSKPDLPSFLCGVGISLLGLLLRTWACGYLKKEKELAVSGPYRYTRNPLYMGNLLLGIGVVVGSRSWIVMGIFAVYFLFFYPVIIRIEQNRMAKLFPEKYREYRQKVPLFFPSFTPRFPLTGTRFSWALYIKNKEFRALAGAAAFWFVLAAKLLLF